MTLHRFINWLLAALIVAIMSCSYLLDAPSDIDASQAQAMSLKDAQRAAQQAHKLEQAQRIAGVAL